MNDKIEELESQLEDIPTQKLYFIYVVIVCSFIFLSWNQFGEGMFNEIESKEESIKALEDKIKRNSIKALETGINKTQKDI
ncbi:MAG: hypothetical protein JXQ66_01155, partial [Campylobacterales bacterium]|nr:hypothetical protein [Campylobacterales bacterium]